MSSVLKWLGLNLTVAFSGLAVGLMIGRAAALNTVTPGVIVVMMLPLVFVALLGTLFMWTHEKLWKGDADIVQICTKMQKSLDELEKARTEPP